MKFISVKSDEYRTIINEYNIKDAAIVGWSVLEYNIIGDRTKTRLFYIYCGQEIEIATYTDDQYNELISKLRAICE